MLFLEEQLNKTPKVRESDLQGPVVGTAAGGATGSPPPMALTSGGILLPSAALDSQREDWLHYPV